MIDAAAVQERLEAIAADLTPQLRTAARFVLTEPASIAPSTAMRRQR